MAIYSKPYLSIPDQVALLKQRGLGITDEPKAEHYLSKIGYYRLSGYSYVFRKSTRNADGKTIVLDDFKENVRFDDILALYVFDKKLRLILLDAIERIEVALRVDIALNLGLHNSKAHLDSSFLYNTFTQPYSAGSSESKYDRWVGKFRKSFLESREDFILHFRDKYPACDLPIWMAVELWDFGTLSMYTGNLKNVYKTPIVKQYGLETIKLLGNWLHTINNVRNICAHHGRLWNRVLATSPLYPSPQEAALLRPMVDNKVPANRIFAAMCIIQYLISYISPNSHWRERLIELINNFPASPYTNISMMGVQAGWQQWQLWE